ncbi:PTS system, mannose-specific IIA component [Enterococcus sp. AZ194]|uniref:PTS sugar transporter subunit IIA n=1 Tax=Enterococcus sp. AZ194 TaxID=2774629 RepID=UPI003F22EFB9
MLGIVIATHGKLSDGLKDAAETIMGATHNIQTVSLNAGDEIQQLGKKIKEAIIEVNQGGGVIVLVDLVGASPYNQSVLAINQLEETIQESVCVIGGVNLAMLLETINHQILETPLSEIAELVIIQGENSLDKWDSAMQSKEEMDEDDF